MALWVPNVQQAKTQTICYLLHCMTCTEHQVLFPSSSSTKAVEEPGSKGYWLAWFYFTFLHNFRICYCKGLSSFDSNWPIKIAKTSPFINLIGWIQSLVLGPWTLTQNLWYIMERRLHLHTSSTHCCMESSHFDLQCDRLQFLTTYV